MLATHQDAENRYEAIRDEVRSVIQSEMPYMDKKNIKLTAINQTALVQAKLWATSPERKVDWDWIDGHREYSFRYPKRFEMAVWHGNTLASLNLGRPTHNGTRMRLDFVEARATSNPLKGRIVPIVLSAIELYARYIGASEARIIDPINENLEQYYSRFGYTLIKQKGANTPSYLRKIL